MKYPIIGNVDRDYILLLPTNSTYRYINFCTQNNVNLITCIRDSDATVLQSRGNDYVGYSKPRLSNLGLCVEEQRSNLLDNNSYNLWTTTGTVTINNINGPNGYKEAALFTETSTSSSQNIYISETVLNTTAYTFSIFAKKGSRRYVQLYIGGTAGGANYYANFDLEDGILGTKGSSITTSTITNVGNDFYRLSISFVTAGTTANCSYGHVSSSSEIANPTFMGTGSTSYIWGAQLEQGTHSTGYIEPTATRASDKISLESNITLPTEWTIFLEADFLYNTSAAQTLLSINNGTANNSLLVYRNLSNSIVFEVKSSGTTVFTKVFDERTGARNTKFAVSFSSNSWLVSCDTEVYNDIAALPTGLTSVQIGSQYDGSLPANCFIKKFSVYNIALDEESLKILTGNEIPVMFTEYLLMETGSFLLLENGNKILLE